jgi:hypothetical protein
MQWWLSEPGISWNNGGFGYNVTNDGGGSYGFSRPNTSLGQAYMRFFDSGNLQFYNADTSGTRVETMIMTSAGNIGIGTAGPAEKLHVEGNLRLGTNPTISWASNTLNIQTATNAIGVVRINGSTSYSPRFEIWNANNAANVIFFDAGGSSFINSGNFGVGTTNPVFKLDIVGSIASRNSSNVSRFVVEPEIAYTLIGVTSDLGSYAPNSGLAEYVSMTRIQGSANASQWLYDPAKKYFTGTVISDGLCAEAISTAGTLVFMTTDGEWGIADADTVGKSTTLLGIALKATSNIGDTLPVLIDGIIALWSNHTDLTTPATPGAPIYVSTTSGYVTETAPSGTGDVVRIVGHNIWGISAGNDVAVIRFKPDNTWIEL